MSMFNITITGNVVADPELRFTSTGKAVMSLRIAFNPRVKQPNGEWEDGEPTFMSVTVWDKAAEAAAEQLSKGQRIIAVGRARTRTWKNDAGEERSAIEMTADEVGVVVMPGKKTQPKAAEKAADEWSDGGDDLPF